MRRKHLALVPVIALVGALALSSVALGHVRGLGATGRSDHDLQQTSPSPTPEPTGTVAPTETAEPTETPEPAETTEPNEQLETDEVMDTNEQGQNGAEFEGEFDGEQ